jgi:hypothetical protein
LSNRIRRRNRTVIDHCHATKSARKPAADRLLGTIRHRYLWVSPRGFSNEGSVYRVRPDQQAAVEAWLDDVDLARAAVNWLRRADAGPMSEVVDWEGAPGDVPTYDDYGPLA